MPVATPDRATKRYREMMQHQKHQQAKHYNRSAKDLPSLQTGGAVYVQLVPNVRRWIPAIIVEALSTRSYRVKTPEEESTLETESSSESDTQT